MSAVRYTFKDVLNSFQFTEAEKQIGMIQIAAYCGGFFDEKFKGSLLSDVEAEKLLSTTVETIEQGRMNWAAYTQTRWLRASFIKEQEAKDPLVHVKRWMDKDEKAPGEEQKFVPVFQKLGLVDEAKWPEEKIAKIVIHGAVEEHLSERINFISEDHEGECILTCGPRCIFKYNSKTKKGEPSFAAIVASIFDNWRDRQEEAIRRIQAVSDTTDKEWLTDPQGLKQLFLDALGEKTWPEKSSYYKNPEPYEQAAINEKRPSPAGLPTAEDLVEYLLKLRAEKTGKFKNVKVKSVLSVVPKPPATTEDNAMDLIKGGHINPNETTVFISNNSKGLHYIFYQDFIVKEVFKRLEKTPGEFSKHVKTVGFGADQARLSSVTDILAKVCFMQLSAEEKLELKNLTKASVDKKSEILVAPKGDGLFAHATSAKKLFEGDKSVIVAEVSASFRVS